MKKLFTIVFVTLMFLALFSSCHTSHSCPAYKNGSAHNSTQVEQNRV